MVAAGTETVVQSPLQEPVIEVISPDASGHLSVHDQIELKWQRAVTRWLKDNADSPRENLEPSEPDNNLLLHCLNLQCAIARNRCDRFQEMLDDGVFELLEAKSGAQGRGKPQGIIKLSQKLMSHEDWLSQCTRSDADENLADLSWDRIQDLSCSCRLLFDIENLKLWDLFLDPLLKRLPIWAKELDRDLLLQMLPALSSP
ncbi:hypothetical protein MMC25_004164 [Agyrium rufum]|nr:hypothetical protein [Agyrium rufum]